MRLHAISRQIARVSREFHYEFRSEAIGLAAYLDADGVECFHDVRVVWAFAIQGRATDDGGAGELGDRVF